MATFKPSDLFIGVVDLLAVVLPGVILTLWVMPLANEYLFPGILAKPASPEANTVVFATASIFLGHLAYGLGAALEEAWETVTSPIAAAVEQPQQPNQQPNQLPADRSYVRRAVELLEHQGHLGADAASKRYCTLLISTKSERAAGEIERLYALARFFRSFAAVLLVIIVAGGAPNDRLFLAWTSSPRGLGRLGFVASLFVCAFVAYQRYRLIHAKSVFRSVLALFSAGGSHTRPSHGAGHTPA